jgi:hypothetical protein
MSTYSSPPYSPDILQTTLHSPEPFACESRISLGQSPPAAATARPRGGEFVKESKSGNLRLRLYRQTDDVTLPVFGIRGPVEGTVEVSKPKSLLFVGVRVRVSLSAR